MANSPLHHLIESLYDLTSQGRVKWVHQPEGVYEIRVEPLAVMLNSKTKVFVLLGPLGQEIASFEFKSLKEAAARGESRYCEVCNRLLDLASKEPTVSNGSQPSSSSRKIPRTRHSKANTSSAKPRSTRKADSETIDVAKAIRDLADKINEPDQGRG